MAVLTSIYVSLSLLSLVILRSLLKKRDTKGFPLPPGPPPLPYIGNVVGIDPDQPWLAYSRWAAEYGEIIYTRLFSQDIIVINSERVARDLLDHRSHNYSTRPPSAIRTVNFLGVEFSSSFLPYSDRWRLHRRILHQGFHPKAAHSFRPVQMRDARNMVLNLLNSPEEYETHVHTFGASVITSIVYDYTISSRDDPFIAMVEQSSEICLREITPAVTALLAEFPILEKLPSWIPGVRFAKSAMLQRSLVPKIVNIPFDHVKKNMAAGTAAPSMVSGALLRISEQAKDGHEAAILEKAVKETSSTAYVAASDTTMATLFVFLLAMILYPDVQARAQEEIDSIIGEGLGRMPDWDDRDSMPYIDAVIKETLRWFPVAPLCIPHSAINDDVYEGYHIPKGATLFANTWSMTRDPKKYPNASKFMPERYMSKVASEDTYAHDETPVAFGFGRRVCVGRHIADASLFAAIVNILAVFRVERVPGWTVGSDGEGVKWMAGGLTTHPVFPCIFTPRHAKVRVVELVELTTASS